jgi:hypothetical protein
MIPGLEFGPDGRDHILKETSGLDYSPKTMEEQCAGCY